MWIGAVVLAAGKSERMGKNKLLLKLAEKRLIDHILDVLEGSRINEITIVLGHKAMEIKDAIKPRLNRIRVIINDRYEEGMTSSFKTGLKHIKHADAVLLVLGDQLILDPTLIKSMIKHAEENRGKTLIISPIYKGKKGHPLLFSQDLFKEILNLTESEVIRDIVHRHIDSLLTIDAAEWTIMDIDTPDDLKEAKRLLMKTASQN